MSDHILVTGGCGFVGTNLVTQLAAEGHRVRVLDDFRTGRAEYLAGLDVEIVKGSVEVPATVTDVLQGVDAVVHLAAAGSVIDSIAEPERNFEANVRGTFTLLNGVRKVGTPKVIFSSTGGALIGNALPPVDEASLPKPISPYGASKLAAEAYCHAFACSYGIRTVSLRFANVYGPYSGHKKGAITAFFQALHDDEPLIIFGDGTASRDFMYVDDICTGIRGALEADVPGGTVAHLATGVETSVAELAEACRRIAGRPNHPILLRPGRAGEVGRNFASCDLARELFCFEPSVHLEEGLARTWRWYLDNVF